MSELEWIGLAMLLVPGIPLFLYACWFIGKSILEEYGWKGLIITVTFLVWVFGAAVLMTMGSNA